MDILKWVFLGGGGTGLWFDHFRIQDHPGLPSKLQDSQGYNRKFLHPNKQVSK